ncbi:MAG: hypothetical protein ACXAE3_14580 [Candidatus Kariarchaeaceae archaeon]
MYHTVQWSGTASAYDSSIELLQYRSDHYLTILYHELGQHPDGVFDDYRNTTPS